MLNLENRTQILEVSRVNCGKSGLRVTTKVTGAPKPRALKGALVSHLKILSTRHGHRQNSIEPARRFSLNLAGSKG